MVVIDQGRVESLLRSGYQRSGSFLESGLTLLETRSLASMFLYRTGSIIGLVPSGTGSLADQVLPGIGLLADKVPYGIWTGFSNSPNSPVRIFDEREKASQEVVFNEEDLVVEFEDQGDVPTLVAIGVRLGGVRSGTSSTAHARGGSSLGVDVSSRIPFKQSKLLSAKKEKGVASRLITLLAHRVSFLPLKVVELKARIRRSHSLSSSSCAKLPSFVPASSSSTSTSFPASILLPKSALDKGKGIVILERESPVQPRNKKRIYDREGLF
ncbi:hypothetical protein LWI28_000378 [Acer negundo]|uniref:Uncharacterized protein n=1 Tax=Acer negundo TaxID=4023 RepID=A0AAD5IBC4_ACENE|nr:hypothetical protein LWI28_000378 [Acer negundo]